MSVESPGFREILDGLERPGAFPSKTAPVRRIETHISAVFLAGDDVFKLKKPVDFGFVDYGTLERRKHFCREEVRLNRRLAPTVYRGVVPVTRDRDGFRIGGSGDAVEYAVHMRRLSSRDRLASLLESGSVGDREIEDLARHLASFHRSSERCSGDVPYAGFEIVQENCLANLEQVRSLSGKALSPAVFERIDRLTRKELDRRRSTIERRAAQKIARDNHGDLRLDHVYRCTGGRRWQVVDCIEFNDRLRCTDPVADIAFLVMDLLRSGHERHARRLLDVWFEEIGDAEGRELVPLYIAYRAMVRCKVVCLQSGDGTSSFAAASPFALLGIGRLAEPKQRPCVILLAGLPGTGKSVLSGRLAESANLEWIRTDAVRKWLAQSAGKAVGEGNVEPDTGIYTRAWSDATYAECLRRAESTVSEGGRALIDGCFPEEHRRELFLDAARRWAVPCRVLHLCASPDVVKQRLAGRTGDLSDADWTTYLALRDRWEKFSDAFAGRVLTVDADPPPEAVEEAARAALRRETLL